MQVSDKNYIRTESRNGSERAFLGSNGFPCCWNSSWEGPPNEGVHPRTFRPEGPRVRRHSGRTSAAVNQGGLCCLYRIGHRSGSSHGRSASGTIPICGCSAIPAATTVTRGWATNCLSSCSSSPCSCSMVSPAA